MTSYVPSIALKYSIILQSLRTPYHTLLRHFSYRRKCHYLRGNVKLHSTLPWYIDLNLYSTQNPPRITNDEYEKFRSKDLLRKLNSRTCVTSNIADFINKNITLIGWIERCSNSENIFIVDGYGKVSCCVSPNNEELQNLCKRLQSNDIVVANGCVLVNPETNQKMVQIDNITSMSMNYENNVPNATLTKNTYSYRTHTCGELRHVNVGEKVTLCGWLQYQRMSKFLLLRDSHGLVQCVLPETSALSNIQLESVIRVDGTVAARPENMVNHNMMTGDVEVNIDKLDILNSVDNIPFTLRNHQKPKEQLRLQYRYIDLRYPEMQNNLRLRSHMLQNMRKFLIEKHSFVEVETPTLFCRTPGGAREFVVPTHHRGLFYSLVQSPQQFKQMLMVGGVDRYFQVARCYRDETTRPDRQPEFTQLDIELSFTNIDGVLKLIEDLLYITCPVPVSKPPFKRLTYREALETYGSDKPDTTYKLTFNNITPYMENVRSLSDFGSYALVLPTALGKLPSKTKDTIRDLKKRYPRVLTLEYSKLSDGVKVELSRKLKLDEAQTLFVTAGRNDDACLLLGEIRTLLANELKSRGLLEVNTGVCEPCWIIDFPLFVKAENGELETCHHPFTAPHPNDIHLLESEPLRVRSLAYDLVMNGNEIGGGSVRVHDPDLQIKLLNILNIDVSGMTHFVKALRSGCPPHAGIALGIDRMMALACDAESIRDVIAFPKSHEGKDPLSGAPNCISEDDKRYYHLDLNDDVELSEVLSVK